MESLFFVCINTDEHSIQTLFKRTRNKGDLLIHKAGTRKAENATHEEAIDDVRKFIYSRLCHYLGRVSDLHAEHFTNLMVNFIVNYPVTRSRV